MDLPDYTTLSDDDLRQLGDAIAAERQRRYVLAQAVEQGTALAQTYADAGGDVEAALDQIKAALTNPTSNDSDAGDEDSGPA